MDNDWNHITNLNPTNAVGKLVEFKQVKPANIFVIDNSSEILINATKLEQYTLDDWQFAMIGKELIRFKNINKVQDNLYKISYLTRGEMGTEEFIKSHKSGECFVILNSEPNILLISKKIENQYFTFKSCNLERTIHYLNKAEKDLPPYITKQEFTGNKLHMTWVVRQKNEDSWQISEEPMKPTFRIEISDKKTTHKIQTSETQLIADISMLDLSDNLKINIITL